MGAIGPSSGTGAVIYHEVGQTVTSKDGDTYYLPPSKRMTDECVVQVDISGGFATVMIQARLSDEAQWKPCLSTAITEVTALGVEGIRTLSYAPQIRAVTMGVSGAPTIRVEVFHGR